VSIVLNKLSDSPSLPSSGPKDFLASIVVFLVALPLCLGIAIASGAPPMTGLITGIIGGIVVGWLAGSPLQVSGPAAGLVALVAEIITDYQMQGLGLILILAGLLQSLAGFLKLGQWFRAISPAVIEGMLAGIGVLIVGSQIHVMLDVTPESNGLSNILSIPQTVLKGLFPMGNATHHWAAMIGVISFVVITLWNLLPARVKLIPASLLAVMAGVIISQWVNLPIRYVELPGSILSGLTLPTLASIGLLADPQVWVWVLTIAIVASAETMLSVTAVDQMQDGPRAHYDKEMIAQGVGNTLCGLVGALPMTGVIVRSSANVHAGAQTRLSAILHGVWLLGLVSFFPHLLELIPTASLAAILVYTGLRLISVTAIRRLWGIAKSEILIYGVTLVMVVGTNLLEGVIAGSLIAILKLLYVLSDLKGNSVENEDGSVNVYLKGSATFLSLPKLVTILEQQPKGRQLTIYIDELNYFDHSCMDALESLEHQYNLSGGTLSVEWQALQDKLPGKKQVYAKGASHHHH
jgi:MFS superfamily sulfate permease-like transporter